MVLEPKPPPKQDEEPRFCDNGEFYPWGNRVDIVTPRRQGLAVPTQEVIKGVSVPAIGKLYIYDNGRPALELDERLYQIDDDLIKTNIMGRIVRYSDTPVLLVGCKENKPPPGWSGLNWSVFHGRYYQEPNWAYPHYCLIQKSSLPPEVCPPYDFGEDEPIEFDKVEFVMDGLSEFTQGCFDSSPFDVEDTPKPSVNIEDWAIHGYTRQHVDQQEWTEPPLLKVDLKTEMGNIVFCLTRKGRAVANSPTRSWETHCTMEFSKMLSLPEITKIMMGVKSFFDFLFQSSLALRKVWVYSSKQIIRDVDIAKHKFLICTDEKSDLSSVNIPVCWKLYWEWPKNFREENKNDNHSVVKIKFDDFADDAKNNLLGIYLGKFINVVVNDTDKELAEFIHFWTLCNYLSPQPLRSALSIHFPALEYFAQKKGIETRTRKVEKWMKPLMKPLGDDYIQFAKDFAMYRNKKAVHYDNREDFFWSSEDWQQGYEKLRVAMRFHLLNILQPDHEDLNKKLASKIWETAWR